MSAKVFTTVEGLEIRIDRYGLATNTSPAVVPDDVAAELEQEIAGERPNPNAGQPGEPSTIAIGSGPRSDIRVERDVTTITVVAAPASRRATAPLVAATPVESNAPVGEKKE